MKTLTGCAAIVLVVGMLFAQERTEGRIANCQGFEGILQRAIAGKLQIYVLFEGKQFGPVEPIALNSGILTLDNGGDGNELLIDVGHIAALVVPKQAAAPDQDSAGNRRNSP